LYNVPPGSAGFSFFAAIGQFVEEGAVPIRSCLARNYIFDVIELLSTEQFTAVQLTLNGITL